MFGMVRSILRIIQKDDSGNLRRHVSEAHWSNTHFTLHITWGIYVRPSLVLCVSSFFTMLKHSSVLIKETTNPLVTFLQPDILRYHGLGDSVSLYGQ